MNLGYRRSAKPDEVDCVVGLCGLEPLIDRLGSEMVKVLKMGLRLKKHKFTTAC